MGGYFQVNVTPQGECKHSKPNSARKRDPRTESLEIPINVVLPQRGSAEPFLRLHNLSSPPRCPRQAAAGALPRVGRGVAGQPSYPLNRFSSLPCDPAERPTSRADLELDYNPPRVQLSDEMFVFRDGRWVNEGCRARSPPLSPEPSLHQRLHKRLAREHLLQDENRALRDETRALRHEVRALRKENRLLRAFWEEREAPAPDDDGRRSPPRDAAGPEAAPRDGAAPAPQRSQEGALQLLREENRALQQLLEQRQSYWAQADGQAGPEDGPPAPEEPPGPGLLAEPSPGPAAPLEEPPGPGAPQEDAEALRALREMVSSLAGPPGGEDEARADGGQPRQLLREMSRALRALREENRLLHALREEHRAFQEENKALWENNQLKLQQRLVIDTVTEVTARMERLIEELYAFVPAKSKEPKKPSRV